MDQTFYSLLESGDDGAVCLRFEGRDLAFAELRGRVDRLAGGLAEIGIGRGDVVGIWLPTTPDWVVAFFAVARVGATMLALNMRFGAFEIGNFARRSGCKAIFYVPDHRGKQAKAVLEQIDRADLVSLRSLVAVGEGPAPALGDGVAHHALTTLEKAAPFAGEGGRPGDRVLIMSSSGTTSQPKLITHSQERLTRHAGAAARHFVSSSRETRVLLIVPTCGVYGFMVLTLAMSAHVPLTMVENFDGALVARLLVEHRITHAYGGNDQIEKILAAAPSDWRAPELALFGHANFTPGLEHLPAQAAARGVRMNGLYGMTEVMALFASQPKDGTLERRALAGGIPVNPAAKARVRSLETGELVAPGEKGSLELWSPDLMLGYLSDEEANRQAFTEDGWLRTGDLAYMMDDGGFVHLSRIGDVLRIAGFLVNPMEIEEAVLAAAPDVSACQVVEINAAGSTRPVAFVIGKPGYQNDEAAIIAACRAKLAIYKVPIRVFEIDDFPITPSPNGNKIKRNELRALAKQRLAAP